MVKEYYDKNLIPVLICSENICITLKIHVFMNKSVLCILCEILSTLEVPLSPAVSVAANTGSCMYLYPIFVQLTW